MTRRFGAIAGLLALLAGCSGGGGTVSAPGGGTGSQGPAACSTLDRQNWVSAQMREWYLFPETLPGSINPASYSTVDAFLDALTATARAQGRDRYFTYLTSIAEENAYYNSGSSAGFGIRLAYSGSRLFVAEAFEGAPALAAGIDRGTEILAIGTSANNLRSVSAILASEGSAGIANALGPDTAGTTRVLQVTDAASGKRTLTIAKADYEIAPVSSRYGARILTEGGVQYGYVNLRTFISPADPALRQAFAQFRAAGVTHLIVDLRYNGGGLVSIAELVGDLMGGARNSGQVFDYMTFRPEKSSQNSVHYFTAQPEAIAPVRVAFIGTGGTASASELVINGALPYFHANAALIGSNTYGKPVGQIAIDRSECDDRLRVIAFAVENANHQSGYFSGLAGTVEASCQAGDDITHPMGDPAESSTRAALDFLQGKSCTAIASGGQSAQSVTARRELLIPDRPSTAQREVPGLF
ncbi:MAG: S41 family peptidase [Pseudomonadota bacterium]